MRMHWGTARTLARVGLVTAVGTLAGGGATAAGDAPSVRVASGSAGGAATRVQVLRFSAANPRTMGHCPERIMAVASAKVSHAGWPVIDGCLVINSANINAVIDLRGSKLHNELLGGHANDTIYGGDAGDVIWADQLANGPANVVDNLHGGAGNDFLYSSHGLNNISTGAGVDHLYLVYGHGTIKCGPGHKILTMRALPQNRHWKLVGCNNRTIIPYAV